MEQRSDRSRVTHLRKAMLDDGNNIYFTWQGKPAGVQSEFSNGKPVFQAWFGEEIAYYRDFDEMVADKFYGGDDLSEIMNHIEINLD